MRFHSDPTSGRLFQNGGQYINFLMYSFFQRQFANTKVT